MANAIKDRCNLKAIKERSHRLEDSAKKQNEYQERKLFKYILGIEKEHEGNMTMLRQQEKELKRTEGKLTRQLHRLNRQRVDGDYVSLPPISMSEDESYELFGQRRRKVMSRKADSSWFDEQTSRESVIIRLLNFPSEAEKGDNVQEEDEGMPLQNARSTSTLKETRIKLPPLILTNVNEED